MHSLQEQIKRIMYAAGKAIPVVAKIEKPEALRNFNKILQVTDAVMVARGVHIAGKNDRCALRSVTTIPA